VSSNTFLPGFGQYVTRQADAGRLVVQPRMGFSAPDRMREGLLAVKRAAGATAGTITLDSYTRVNRHQSALRHIDEAETLNGYPIVAYGPDATRAMLDGIEDAEFPIQVRHGSADPREIFAAMLEAGLFATEGGPISYCLPYSRMPLAEAVPAWRESTEILAQAQAGGAPVHMETFGGCLLGQLCPPSLLVAVSVLEGIFFHTHGLNDLSLSYAQQTSPAQDREAVAALRRLAEEFLPGVDWHVVIYTYMGLFPSTLDGAQALLDESVRLASESGAERLIVKTALEAFRIPTIEENVEALERSADLALQVRRMSMADGLYFDMYEPESETYIEARGLVEGVLGLDSDIDNALLTAFERGILDIPFCLHPDNRNESRSVIAADGRLQWLDTGQMPIPQPHHTAGTLTADGLLTSLNYIASRYDRPLEQADQAEVLTTGRERSGIHALPGEEPKIVIVGAGPRGLSVLERLVTIGGTMDRPLSSLAVEIIDPYPPGAGRIWRSEQSGALLMNTVIGQISIFGHDPAEPEEDAGPSFYEWLQSQPDPELQALPENGYAPRRVYGMYLSAAFEHVLAEAPEWMHIQSIRDEVVKIGQGVDGYYVTLREGGNRHADAVVLTTGHPRNELRPHEKELADFAERHGVRYVPGDSAADMPLDEVTKDDVVAIRGLGLTFYDVCARLTADRGGKFVRDAAGTLTYEPSGEEPQIYAGSRSGLPFPARGVNQKQLTDSYTPVVATAEKIDELRAARREEHEDDRLDFKQEVLPLLMIEVHRTYTANVIRQRYGNERAEEFLQAFDGPAGTVSGTVRTFAQLRQDFGVGDIEDELPDLEKLARPFQEMSYDSPDEFNQYLTGHLEHDLAEAKLGNRYGPLKASLDVLRDLRGVIRKVVEHDGLLPDSQEWFDKWYTPRNSLLSAGPPAFRVEQCVALMRAGIVHVVGPETRFRGDESLGKFTVESPHVVDSFREATWLVEANSPDPQLGINRSELYKQMREDGFVSEHLNPHAEPGGADRQTGGLNVSPAPYRIISADGTVHEDVFALGIPTEHTNWFTQVGSGKPGARSAFTRDARLIAEGALKRVFGETAPRGMTRMVATIGSGD
jgi:glutamate mutase epsilon subunit